MKNVVLLGSTGSIGTSTIKVAEDLPDRIRLLGLAAGNNLELLLEQTRKHRPEAISITNPEKAKTARDALGDRKSTRLNSSHRTISYAVFCLNKKKKTHQNNKN